MDSCAPGSTAGLFVHASESGRVREPDRHTSSGGPSSQSRGECYDLITRNHARVLDLRGAICSASGEAVNLTPHILSNEEGEPAIIAFAALINGMFPRRAPTFGFLGGHERTIWRKLSSWLLKKEPGRTQCQRTKSGSRLILFAEPDLILR